MSNPNAYYMLAGLCVVGGVVTHIFAPDGPIALALVMAGAGALAKAAHQNGQEAAKHQQEALKERKRGDALFEETQTMMKKP